jgi:hypothetical protein
MILPAQIGMAADGRLKFIIDKQQITTPCSRTTGGRWYFYERRKFAVQLSHKLLDESFLCRICTGVKQTLDHVSLVFVSFLVLLVDVFLALLLAEEYPSAYHPPPTSLKEQADIIFLARRLHLGHLICAVPIGTRRSVIVPSGHWNS